MNPSCIIDRSVLLKRFQEKLDSFTEENFATDPETGVSEGSRGAEEYRNWLEETIEEISLFPPISTWRDRLPDAQGLWWWHNGDEDSIPIVVNIAYSGHTNSYFATHGQHGWNRFQNVEEMGGMWMQIEEPEAPTEQKT